MSAINKELYDVLINANVSDDLATKAARSISADLQDGRSNIGSIKEELANISGRLALVEKLQWIVVTGVIAIIIKTYLS